MNALTLIAIVAAGAWILTRDKRIKEPVVTEGEQIPPLSLEIVYNENANRNPAGGWVFNLPGTAYVTNNTDKELTVNIRCKFPDMVLTQHGSRVPQKVDEKNNAFNGTLVKEGEYVIPAGGTIEIPFYVSINMRGSRGTYMYSNVNGDYTYDFYFNYTIGDYEYSELVTTTAPEKEQ